MHINTERCLIIPDVHQNTAWVDRIFEQERDYDIAVFLGDYFDTAMPRKQRTGVMAMCEKLMQRSEDLGNKGQFLLGNHDIQYLEAKPACDRYRTPRNLNYKCGSAYSHAAAAKISKGLTKEFWNRARLFLFINGWLVSHAGVANSLWPARTNILDSLGELEAQAETALHTMRKGPHPLLQAGRVRGGDASTGGITWLDWDEEFRDDLPCPQIVGHTASANGARRNGRSWCLDGHQTCYGMLTSAGLEIRHA